MDCLIGACVLARRVAKWVFCFWFGWWFVSVCGFVVSKWVSMTGASACVGRMGSCCRRLHQQSMCCIDSLLGVSSIMTNLCILNMFYTAT